MTSKLPTLDTIQLPNLLGTVGVAHGSRGLGERRGVPRPRTLHAEAHSTPRVVPWGRGQHAVCVLKRVYKRTYHGGVACNVFLAAEFRLFQLDN